MKPQSCHRKTTDQRGLAPVIIAVIAAAILVIGGLAYVLISRWGPGAPEEAATEEGGIESVADLELDLPVIDFSASDLPSLELATLDLELPDLTAGGAVFPGFAVNSDFSAASDLGVALPVIADSDLVPENLPPPPPPGDGQGDVNQANCAQFSAMPSAQYCSAVGDPSGRALCEACKAAGF